jgi:xylan 1,4-beta-xylosidase
VSIENPVLRGFRPDPCICRVGADFFIATSTFEWFPGVEIHHSRDLRAWKLIGRALDRSSQLPLEGIPNSGGIWAPHLSFDGNRFYLVYTICYGLTRPWRDFINYIVEADSPIGPWSDPIAITGWGFDPSLFHDDDGRKYLLHTAWDGRLPGIGVFYGIMCREVLSTDPPWQLGPPRRIWQGTDLGLVEGPHLIKKDGFYYLVCAEGGTGYDHAVSIARSRSLWGPYEVHPDNPILTSKGDMTSALQKAGHASMVPAFAADEWVMAHLCGRPVDCGEDATPRFRCLLGRETALQVLRWPEGDWPRLRDGGNRPGAEVRFAGAPTAAAPFTLPPTSGALPIDYHTLRRVPEDSWLRFESGILSLRGGFSLDATFQQSLVARRLESLACEFRVRVTFLPENFMQRAGIVYYYDRNNYYGLALCGSESGTELRVFAKREGEFEDYPAGHLGDGSKTVELEGKLLKTTLNFGWRNPDDASWSSLPHAFDASTLSDEYGRTSPFTGAFVGVFCMDAAEHSVWAHFSELHAQELTTFPNQPAR